MKSALNHIIVRGARQHNLKNINLEIPKGKMVVFTGVSGSGKSSLAMDTIYAEGQRRYVESLSAYARQFLGVMDKPDVDTIEGLSPAIAIDQRTTSRNPRSTVGTITEVYDFMRLLFARVGHPHCSNCGREIQRQSVDEIVDGILSLVSVEKDYTSERGVRFIIFSPMIRDRKGEFSTLFTNIKRQGILRVRVDGEVRDVTSNFNLIKTNKHTVEALISRHVVTRKKVEDLDEVQNLKSTLTQSIESALRLSNGSVVVSIVYDNSFDVSDNPKEFKDHLFSENFACPICNISLPDMEPRFFSFNSPHGACPKCDGLGTERKIEESLIVNPNLSVSEGGILPWSKLFEHYSWTRKIAEAVSQEYKFSLDTEIKNLDRKHVDILLYGSGDKKFKIDYKSAEGNHHTFNSAFEGVIPNLSRRYKETESDYIRNEIERYMILEPCPLCLGFRLKKETLSVVIQSMNIKDVSDLPISDAQSWFLSLSTELTEREQIIASQILKEINYRLKFLVDVGLSYLTLSRSASHLSGGEAQRIRLASQIGSGLSGVLYVLDEPSIGLHQRDQGKLISTLHHLRDLGNTVLVVEHDLETMLQSDYIFDFGPGAGSHGGNVIAEGTPEQITNDKNSITGRYLSGKSVVGKSGKRAKDELERLLEDEANQKVKQKIEGQSIVLKGAQGRNLKKVDFELPLGKFVCVTGVSGSGKSTLVMDTLYVALRQHFGLKIEEKPEPFRDISGLEYVTNVIAIDQTPIGRTPKSNPATYTKTFDLIRDLFSKTQEARIRGYTSGRFSFNVKGGRCEACAGEGQIRIEMQFMPDVYVNCEVCQGKRYNREALEIYYKNKNIADVLAMTVEEALGFFDNVPGIKRKLQTLYDVGLSYITLGQPATTLSGGEAQRIKLASELSKRATGSSLYILDEPTTGLHFADLENLITIIKRLTARGNTVLVIEHNLDIIANAEWVVDLGPEGGNKGGNILYSGTLENMYKLSDSYTADSLRKYLKALRVSY